jgi:hypothetical protein
MQITSLSPWLMMASTATAVRLPVADDQLALAASMGTIASIAFRPVCAARALAGDRRRRERCAQSGMNVVLAMGPLPSMAGQAFTDSSFRPAPT